MTHYLITQTKTGIIMGCIEAETPEQAWQRLCEDIGAYDWPVEGIVIAPIEDTDVCTLARRDSGGAITIPPLTTDTICDWHQAITDAEDVGALDALLIGWSPWTMLYRVTDEDGIVTLYARPLSDTALVRAVRKALGLTQTELAKQLGMDLRTVQRWEGGETPVDTRTRLALMLVMDRGEAR